MKKWIVFGILCASLSAQAKTMLFTCKWDNQDLAFSTSVDDNAVEIRRAYDWNDTVFYVRIPLVKNSDETWADVQVTVDGKSTMHQAFCLMETM
jgi:hypothetical protein